MTNEEIIFKLKSELDSEQRNHFIELLWQQNSGLIHEHAVKYKGLAEIDDLKQEAFFGFLEAVEKYDESRGATFATYCIYWVKNAMYKYLLKDSAVSVSYSTKEMILQYNSAFSTLVAVLGREPEEKEIAGLMGVSREKVQNLSILSCQLRTASLNETVGDAGDNDQTLGDTLAANTDIENEVVSKVYNRKLYEALWDAVGLLPELEAKVIKTRYIGNRTYKGVGELCGIKMSDARKLEASGLRKLRARCNKVPILKDYRNTLRDTSKAYRNNDFFRTMTSSTEAIVLKDIGLV